MLYDLKFVIDMTYDMNEYANTSCLNAPGTPHFPILRCDNHEEAHVKQLSTDVIGMFIIN
jgi:hypothetical protein